MAEYINNTEYIDRKELVNNINRLVKLTNKDEQEWVKDECIRQAYCIQKADVVPRSEVEVLEAELSRYTENFKQMVEQAKQEVTREIFEEIERFLFDDKTLINITKFAELKKKFIGEEK